MTFLQTESTTQAMAIMQFGMFAGLNQSREEEFQIAEFVGDADDGMNLPAIALAEVVWIVKRGKTLIPSVSNFEYGEC